MLIADEPVSALDVSVQANIINLLTDLQETLHLSVIFVSHNMAVVRQISDRTAVMYRGRIVETGETETLFDDPVHPYTKLLIGSVPRLAEAGDAIEPDAVAAAESGVEAAGANPMLAEITASAARGGTSPCRYADRCPAVVAACAVEPSLIADPRDSGRSAACVHVTERKGVVA